MTAPAGTPLKGLISNAILIGLGAGIAYLAFAWQRSTQPAQPSERPALSRERPIAVGPDGRIFVGEGASVEVDGAVWETDAPVHALAVDSQGQVYVASATYVQVFDPRGRSLRRWGRSPTEGFRLITGLAVDGDEIFIADAGARLVYRYSSAGEARAVIGEEAEDVDHKGFVLPTPFLDCAAREGVLYVNNPGRLRVEMFAYDGTPRGHWGKAGFRDDEFPGCCNPTNLAVLPDGRIAVSQKGKPLIKLFSAGGVLEACFGDGLFSPEDQGIDLAVTPDSRIVAATPERGILRFRPTPAVVAPGE